MGVAFVRSSVACACCEACLSVPAGVRAWPAVLSCQVFCVYDYALVPADARTGAWPCVGLGENLFRAPYILLDYYTDCATGPGETSGCGCGMGNARRRGRSRRADRSVTVTSVGWINRGTLIYKSPGERCGGGVSAARATADCRVPRKNRAGCPVVVRPLLFALSERGARTEVAQVLLSLSAFSILVVSVHVSRGDTVIRAASRSRLSAYRDFDILRVMIACGCPRRIPPRPAGPAHPTRRSDVWGRSRESSTGKISRVLHEDMFHMTQHHHMLLKPTRDVREGKAWAGKAKTPLQFPAQHQ